MIRTTSIWLGAFAATLFLGAGERGTQAAPRAIEGLDVRDQHGRSLQGQFIELVDWEGQLANPVLRLDIVAGPELTGEFTVELTADGSRLQFNKPSTVGADGPSKELEFDGPGMQSVYVSIYPDRADGDEDYSLRLTKSGSAGEILIPIHVRDEDLAAPDMQFQVHVNFDEDTTGFFDDALARDIVQMAADDWAYFIANPPFDQVPALDELSFIYDADAVNGEYVTNDGPYTGFLLYMFGWQNPALISGGIANFTFETKRQKVGGQTWEPELSRSGGVGVETRGNYNQLGWYFSADDDDWWTHDNANTKITDFYSIMRHEIGHALAFHTNYEAVTVWEAAGEAAWPPLLLYYGGPVPMNPAFDHFEGVDDPASLKGAFGWEYGGEMPNFRWQITKLDVMLLGAMGYPLRYTSAFWPVAFAARPQVLDETIDFAIIDEAASIDLPISGGVPLYLFEAVEGTLPDGMMLDSFSGRISGTPTTTGQYAATIRVRDSALAGASEDLFALDLRVVDPEFDANCSGVVDGIDAVAVLRDIVNLEPLPFVACTGDNDGVPGLSLADAMGISRRVALLD